MSKRTVAEPEEFSYYFDQVLNAGDLESLLELYDHQASFRASDGSVRQGVQALRLELQGLISAKAELHNQLRHVFQSGDTALILVDWTLRLDLPDAGHVESKGTATNVLRYSEVGGWQMLIANPQGTA